MSTPIDQANKFPKFRAYTKKQLRHLLVDPLTNPDAPDCTPMHPKTLHKLIVDNGLLKQLKLKEQDYNRLRILSASQCEIIFRALI